MTTFWERAVRSVDPIYLLCILYICNFGFEGGIRDLIVAVAFYCSLVALIG